MAYWALIAKLETKQLSILKVNLINYLLGVTWRAQSWKALRETSVRHWENTNSLKICWLISLGSIEKVVYLSMSCNRKESRRSVHLSEAVILTKHDKEIKIPHVFYKCTIPWGKGIALFPVKYLRRVEKLRFPTT